MIVLLNYGHFEKDMLQSIADDITNVFLHPVTIKDSTIDLNHYYDAARRQYDGNQLLKEVDSLVFQGAQKKMGLFRVDLFIPILTYIFGQAFYKGNSGIASLYRLKNEQYGMKPDEDLLAELNIPAAMLPEALRWPVPAFTVMRHDPFQTTPETATITPQNCIGRAELVKTL